MRIKCALLLMLLTMQSLTHGQEAVGRGKSIEEDNKKHKKRRLALGIGLLGLGATMEFSGLINKVQLQNSIQRSVPYPKTYLDDYFRYVPLAIAAGLKIGSAKGEHKLGGQLLRVVPAILVNDYIVTTLKRKTHRIRPDNTSNTSFPSGHTAQAFVSARFLDREYGSQYPWLSWVGYGFATATGALRVAKNRHWVSDVLVGAGIGILTVDLTYWIFKKDKRKSVRISPLINGDVKGATFVYRF